MGHPRLRHVLGGALVAAALVRMTGDASAKISVRDPSRDIPGESPVYTERTDASLPADVFPQAGRPLNSPTEKQVYKEWLESGVSKTFDSLTEMASEVYAEAQKRDRAVIEAMAGTPPAAHTRSWLFMTVDGDRDKIAAAADGYYRGVRFGFCYKTSAAQACPFTRSKAASGAAVAAPTVTIVGNALSLAGNADPTGITSGVGTVAQCVPTPGAAAPRPPAVPAVTDQQWVTCAAKVGAPGCSIDSARCTEVGLELGAKSTEFGAKLASVICTGGIAALGIMCFNAVKTGVKEGTAAPFPTQPELYQVIDALLPLRAGSVFANPLVSLFRADIVMAIAEKLIAEANGGKTKATFWKIGNTLDPIAASDLASSFAYPKCPD